MFKKTSHFGLAATILVAFTGASLHAEALYKYKGKSYSLDQLSPSLQNEVYEAEFEGYQRKKSIAEEALLEAYFGELAKKQNKPMEQVRDAELAAKEPTEAQIKDFYEKNKARIPKEYTYDTIKPQIVSLLQREQMGDKRNNLLKKILADKSNSIEIKEPVSPEVSINLAGFPAKGALDSKVVLVEFADYQCPHCKHAFDGMKTLWPKYEKKVKMVFIDFPINPSGISTTVAEGAVCAQQQGKYWEYHGMAFEKQMTLSKDSPVQFAKELKLDEKKFAACLTDKSTKDFISKAKAEGERVGVKGTPALFINGKRLNITSSFEDSVTKALDKALGGNSKV